MRGVRSFVVVAVAGLIVEPGAQVQLQALAPAVVSEPLGEGGDRWLVETIAGRADELFAAPCPGIFAGRPATALQALRQVTLVDERADLRERDAAGGHERSQKALGADLRPLEDVVEVLVDGRELRDQD